MEEIAEFESIVNQENIEVQSEKKRIYTLCFFDGYEQSITLKHKNSKLMLTFYGNAHDATTAFKYAVQRALEYLRARQKLQTSNILVAELEKS